MSVIFGVLVAVLLAVVLLLAIPLTLRFSFSWPQTGDNAIRLSCLFGMVNVGLPFSGTVAGNNHQLQDNSPSGKKKRTLSNRETAGSKTHLRSLAPVLSRFIRRCWRAIEKNDIKVGLRMGLGDPADTGVLLGLLSPLLAIISKPGSLSVQLVPDFSDAVIELESSGSIRFVPLQLVALALGLMATPALWRVFR